MESMLFLPNSTSHQYPPNFWQDVEAKLNELSEHPEWNVLKETITQFQGDAVEAELPGLQRALASDNARLPRLLQRLCGQALALPRLFPQGTLQPLDAEERPELRLDDDECTCLLANMFFCTIRPARRDTSGCYRNKDDTPIRQSTPQTFYDWYTSPPDQDGCAVSDIYIQSLLNYFHHQQKAKEIGQSVVSFKLCQLGSQSRVSWPDSTTPLISQSRPIELRLQGRIGDDDDSENVDVDFANRSVGFGRGGTQEELLLGTRPAACLAGLLSPVLSDDQCLLICGAARHGDYSGFGSSARYRSLAERATRSLPQKSHSATAGSDRILPAEGEVTQLGSLQEEGRLIPQATARSLLDNGLVPRTILCLDSLRFDGLPADNRAEQLTPAALERELNKAFCGFSSVLPDAPAVSTGPWGCGAFGGDPEVKCLLQMLAAAEAGRAVVYHAFGDEDFASRLDLLIGRLDEVQATVGEVFRILREAGQVLYSAEGVAEMSWRKRADGGLFLFEFVQKKLGEV